MPDRLSDEDLDRIERDQADTSVPDRWPVETVTALVAEVRRLRADAFVRDAQNQGISPVERQEPGSLSALRLRQHIGATHVVIAHPKARPAWAALAGDTLHLSPHQSVSETPGAVRLFDLSFPVDHPGWEIRDGRAVPTPKVEDCAAELAADVGVSLDCALADESCDSLLSMSLAVVRGTGTQLEALLRMAIAAHDREVAAPVSSYGDGEGLPKYTRLDDGRLVVEGDYSPLDAAAPSYGDEGEAREQRYRGTLIERVSEWQIVWPNAQRSVGYDSAAKAREQVDWSAANHPAAHGLGIVASAPVSPGNAASTPKEPTEAQRTQTYALALGLAPLWW
jgi:hypothetical protein